MSCLGSSARKRRRWCSRIRPAKRFILEHVDVRRNGHDASEGARRQFGGPSSTSFLSASFASLAAHSEEGSIHFIGMDWHYLSEMLEAGQAHYTELKNVIVWVRDDGGKGRLYHPRHRLNIAFQKGSAADPDSFALAKRGSKRTNVWQYRYAPAKPVALIADAIGDVSRRGGIVLDTFGDFGSTLIAADKTGRRARVVEMDPIRCDRILRRWEIFARKEAELLARDPKLIGSASSSQGGC